MILTRHILVMPSCLWLQHEDRGSIFVTVAASHCGCRTISSLDLDRFGVIRALHSVTQTICTESQQIATVACPRITHATRIPQTAPHWQRTSRIVYRPQLAAVSATVSPIVESLACIVCRISSVTCSSLYFSACCTHHLTEMALYRIFETHLTLLPRLALCSTWHCYLCPDCSDSNNTAEPFFVHQVSCSDKRLSQVFGSVVSVAFTWPYFWWAIPAWRNILFSTLRHCACGSASQCFTMAHPRLPLFECVFCQVVGFLAAGSKVKEIKAEVRVNKDSKSERQRMRDNSKWCSASKSIKTVTPKLTQLTEYCDLRRLWCRQPLK